MTATDITFRTPDAKLRELLTDPDPDVADAAKAEQAERLRMAGGATLELLGEEADR